MVQFSQMRVFSPTLSAAVVALGCALPAQPAAGATPDERALLDLQARVVPGVVLLTVVEDPGPGRGASVVPATLITASGLALTSRHAIAAAIDDGSSRHPAVLAMVLGSRGRLGARNLAAAMPVRVVATCDALDLALVEARPPGSLFLPHLPIARGAQTRPGNPTTPAGAASGATASSTLLAVHHDRKAGFWAARSVTVPASGPPLHGTRRLPLDRDALGIEPGAPLFDALGQLAGMVVAEPGLADSRGAGSNRDGAGGNSAAAPPDGVEASGVATDPDRPAAMVTADTLFRFLLAANAPALRFAGIPPSRRPVLGVDVPVRRTSKHDPVALASAAAGTASRAAADLPLLGLPKISSKGPLERFRRPEPGEVGPTAAPPAPARATGGGSAVPAVTLAMLEAVSLRASIGKAEGPPQAGADWEPRGPASAPIAITVLGDYHSSATREADGFLRALSAPQADDVGDAGPPAQPAPSRPRGATVPIRVFWRDADRGFGDDYLLASRAARAAGEQGAFWPMHDLLMAETQPLDPARVRELGERLDLDLGIFEAALTSDGLTAAVETANDDGSATAVLATPSFVVDGRIVEGGSVAVTVLAAAIEDARGRIGGGGKIPGAATSTPMPPRLVAPHGAVRGFAFSDPASIARAATRTVARTAERAGHD